MPFISENSEAFVSTPMKTVKHSGTSPGTIWLIAGKEFWHEDRAAWRRRSSGDKDPKTKRRGVVHLPDATGLHGTDRV